MKEWLFLCTTCTFYTTSIDKYYYGQSSNVDERSQYHNSEQNCIWTRRGRSWMLAGIFAFTCKKEAIVAERFIKNQKSRKTVERILADGFRNGDIVLHNIVRASDPG